MVAALFISFFLFVIINVPVAIAIALSSMAAIAIEGSIPFIIVVQKMFTSVDSFPFMAVPFFILAGLLMEHGGISRRLVDYANSLVGGTYGGLALVAITASMFFGAISGSAAATVAAIGTILIPAMIEKGYEKSYATAVQASAGTLGVMIPPSIPLIVYGVLSEVSVGALFIGGLLPGIIVGASLMLVARRLAKKKGYGTNEKPGYKKKSASFQDAFFALLMPVIILGGIYGGYFTPTEAAVIAVVYGFIVGFFIYKELKINSLGNILVSAVVSTAVIMFIIATASVFGWILASEQVPRLIAELILSLTENPIIILALINVLLLLLGTFLETTAAIIIMAPVFVPVVTQIGIDPLHFGIVMVVNLAVGMVTPPLGVCLFVGCSIADVSLEDITRAILPFIIIMIIDIAVITYIPAVSTLLPRLTGM
jgi:C4-dicarboxylate transporter DctM subunit